MNQTIISVDKILRVYFTSCKQSRIFRWEKTEPAIKIFGFTLCKENPEGWVTTCSDSDSYGCHKSICQRISEEKILSDPRYFKRYDVPKENSIWEKAIVSVESMSGRYTTFDHFRFESDKEALDCMNSILEKLNHIKFEYKG